MKNGFLYRWRKVRGGLYRAEHADAHVLIVYQSEKTRLWHGQVNWCRNVWLSQASHSIKQCMRTDATIPHGTRRDCILTTEALVELGAEAWAQQESSS